MRNDFYSQYIKRVLDFVLSLSALFVLAIPMIILLIIGSIVMKGSPVFVQKRPGKNEKIISLIKFRSMTNEKDADGKLLPDEKRLTKYGKFLRATSIDELPSLINILKGDLSIIGPRPLLIAYLPWYTEEEKHRHDVRPGLTGWAQVNGRNSVEWDARLKFDLEYVNNLSFWLDAKIFFLTVKKVLTRSDVAENTNAIEGNFAAIRKAKAEAAANSVRNTE